MWSRVVEVANAGADSAMRRLLRLPSFFDAIIDESDKSCTDNDVCHVSDGVNDAVVTDPHVTGSDPGTSHLVVEHLVGAAHLGNDMSDGGSVSVTDKVIGHHVEILVDDTLPSVLVTPPLEFVPLVGSTSSSCHIDVCIVAEFKLDPVGGYEARLGLRCL